MSFDKTAEFLQQFETGKVIAYLHHAEIHELMRSPYFLAIAGTLAVIALLMRWRVLLASILCITGFAYLLSYTLDQGTSLEGGVGNETLMVFIAGGALIVFLAIYLLFIKDE